MIKFLIFTLFLSVIGCAVLTQERDPILMKAITSTCQEQCKTSNCLDHCIEGTYHMVLMDVNWQTLSNNIEVNWQ